MKKMILALAAAGAIVATAALPAAAAPIADNEDFPAVNGVTWRWFHDDNFAISDAETASYNDAFDGVGNFEWYSDADNWSDYVTCLNADVTEDSGHPGDYILTCDSQDNVSLNVSTDVTSRIAGRIYAEGDLLRLEYTLTNNSDTAVDFSWWSQTAYGEAYIDDDAATDLTRGFDIQNADYGYDEGFAFGLPGAAQTPDNLDEITANNDYVEVYGPETYQTLEPGKSMTIVLFYFHDMGGSTAAYPSATYDNLSLWASDQFSTWDERLSRGIASDVFVANWMTEAPSNTDDSLAGTGMDSTGALALAGVSLVAGAAAMIVRRRRTA